MKDQLKNKKLIWGVVGIIVILGIVIFMLFNQVPDKNINAALNEKEIKMIVSDKYQLNLMNKDTDKKIVKGIKWTSVDKKIADVGKDGLVTAISEGNVVMTCSYENKKYECKVSVENLQFEVPENLEIKIDETKLLEVKTNSKNVVNFESNNTSIATIDNKGNLKGIKEGSVEITVKLNDTTKICKLTVVKSETSNEGTSDSPTDSYSPEQPNNGGSTSSNSSTNKPSGNTGSSSSKPSNNGGTTTKPSTGGSTSGGGNSSTPAPAPQPKPEPAPTPTPKPEPTYSYFGRQAYNWILNNGGKIINGSAHIGNPDKNNGDCSSVDFMAKVQNVGTKDTDYIITLGSGLESNHPAMQKIISNCFESEGYTIRNNILNANINFSLDGRNYNVSQGRFGYVINVSAKAS